MRFLNSLDIPLVATLRDTQNYVRSAEAGIGIHEMPRWQVYQDLDQWERLTAWLSRNGALSQRPASSIASP